MSSSSNRKASSPPESKYAVPKYHSSTKNKDLLSIFISALGCSGSSLQNAMCFR